MVTGMISQRYISIEVVVGCSEPWAYRLVLVEQDQVWNARVKRWKMRRHEVVVGYIIQNTRGEWICAYDLRWGAASARTKFRGDELGCIRHVLDWNRVQSEMYELAGGVCG